MNVFGSLFNYMHLLARVLLNCLSVQQKAMCKALESQAAPLIGLLFILCCSLTAQAAARPVSCFKTHSIFAKRSVRGKAAYAALKAKKEAEANAHKEAPKIEVTDADSFAEAMTQGMLLHPTQGDLFGIYLSMYLGNPKTDLNGKSFATVMQILRENPNLEKSHFPEFEINKVVKVYESPEALDQYIRSQISTNAQFRSNLFQIEANLVFWKKLLRFEDPAQPEALQKPPQKDSSESEKEAYKKVRDEFRQKQARSQKRFMAYLDRIISKPNRDLLKNDSVEFEQKIEVLFKTLQQLAKHLDKNKKDSGPVRQVMVDLVHSTGYNNPATVALLKNSDAIQRLEGLGKIFEERDSMAMKLGFEGHFTDLLKKMNIEFPSLTGVPEATTEQTVSSLRQLTLKGKFTTKPIDTIRVRSLSIQEAGFRSCLGGSDCSTRTYFSKAFDPNYHYFTMTDRNHKSTGHLTVVLGEAKNPATGQLEKVAFADKLQNVPNHLIPEFLQAISSSLSKKGYRLAIPEKLELPQEAQYHGGLSNTPTILQFLQDHILSKLQTRLTKFTPHAHQYKFENQYSRADKSLSVRLYEPTLILAVDTEIRPGFSYKSYLANSTMNKDQLIAKFLALRDSKNPEEIIQYISSRSTVEILQQQKLFSTLTFYNDLVHIMGRPELPFKVRKTAWLEYYQNIQNWDHIFQHLEKFGDTERTTLVKEIRDWSQSTNPGRKHFSEKLFSKMAQFSYRYADNGDVSSIRYLIKNNLIDGNAKDGGRETIFYYAVARQKPDLVQYLGTVPGIKLNEKDIQSMTPADYFYQRFANVGKDFNLHGKRSGISDPQALAELEKMARILLQIPGIDKSLRNKLAQAVLHHPIAKDQILPILFRDYELDFNALDSKNSTPLEAARLRNETDTFLLLWNHPGIKVDSESKFYHQDLIIKQVEAAGGIEKYLEGKDIPRENAETFFMLAAAEGNIPLLKRLLEVQDLNINKVILSHIKELKGNEGVTALEAAVNWAPPKTVEFILGLPGLKLRNFEDYRGPLYLAIMRDDQQVIDLLLNIPGITVGPWPLYRAWKNGHKVSLQKMLKYPMPNINKPIFDFSKDSLLLEVLDRGSPNDLKMLLSIPEIDINFRYQYKVRDSDGMKTEEVSYDNPAISKILRRIKYKPHRDEGRESYWEENDQILQLMLAHPGLNLSLPGTYGQTPLIYAVGTQVPKVVRWIVEKMDKDTINVKDSDGWTALSLAKKYNLTEIIEILIQAGAKDEP